MHIAAKFQGEQTAVSIMMNRLFPSADRKLFDQPTSVRAPVVASRLLRQLNVPHGPLVTLLP